MRSGWLILTLLIATGTNLTVVPSMCGAHMGIPSSGHPSMHILPFDQSSAQIIPPGCMAGTAGHSSPHPLGINSCNFCDAQASTDLPLVKPFWGTTSPMADSSPIASEIYLLSSTKPPTITHS